MLAAKINNEGERTCVSMSEKKDVQDDRMGRIAKYCKHKTEKNLILLVDSTGTLWASVTKRRTTE